MITWWGSFLVVLASAKANTPRSIDRRPDQAQSERRRLRSRVTDELRGEVVQLYASGMTSRAVAEEVGIGRTTVLNVLRREGVTIRPQGARY
ncbi:helix-turn-helix domain-containing protein [Gordonia alkanivorans]|uniref:helix-turn-helix domain-containing protein n=1 Tax=Gordonia alkanivorans TaxID=84096 RepID=UPI003CC5AD81